MGFSFLPNQRKAPQFPPALTRVIDELAMTDRRLNLIPKLRHTSDHLGRMLRNVVEGDDPPLRTSGE